LLEEWPETKMIGFEPHPKIYNGIKDKFPGILFNLAVSDKPKKVVLYSKPNHKDGSSIFPHSIEDNNKNTFEGINALNLDALEFSLYREGEKTLLWLDCEGGELDVLDGAREFITEVGMVNVEMTGSPNGVGWCSPEEVHQQLHEDGFFLQITHTNRPSAGQYDGLYVRKEIFNPGYCNCPMEITRYRKACNAQ
jgi:FkbM family methyltransferase